MLAEIYANTYNIDYELLIKEALRCFENGETEPYELPKRLRYNQYYKIGERIDKSKGL